MTPIHLAALAFTLVHVVWADSLGLRWVLGSRTTLDHARLNMLHRRVWYGLAALIVTGALMAVEGFAEGEIVASAFAAKMAFVALLVANSFVIGSHMQTASTTPFKELPRKQQLILILSGMLSTLGWLGAIALGFTIEAE